MTKKRLKMQLVLKEKLGHEKSTKKSINRSNTDAICFTARRGVSYAGARFERPTVTPRRRSIYSLNHPRRLNLQQIEILTCMEGRRQACLGLFLFAGVNS